MRRRLLSIFVILTVIATMLPLSMGAVAQTPVAAPNTDISGTIDVAMVANPQMVAFRRWSSPAPSTRSTRTSSST